MAGRGGNVSTMLQKRRREKAALPSQREEGAEVEEDGEGEEEREEERAWVG